MSVPVAIDRAMDFSEARIVLTSYSVVDVYAKV